MVGDFEVSRNRIDEFYSQSLSRIMKFTVIAFQLPLSALIIIFHKNRFELLTIFFLFIFLLVICVASVKAERSNGKFEATCISIDKTHIKRKGKDLLTVSIDFKNIRRVIEIEDGLVITQDGHWTKMTFLFGGKYILSQEPGILFIPSMIKDFEKLRDFFVNKKYINK